MNIPWKAMLLAGAAGVLSICPLPLKAGEPADGTVPGEGWSLSPGTSSAVLALADPSGKGMRTKRVVIRTDGDDRPRLGVVLRFEKSSKSDPKGAFVQGVTPGSPADEAGVAAGDIIVKFNGQPLTGGSAGDESLSAPAQRLVQMAQKLSEGDKVTLELLRGDKTLSLDVVARKLKGNTAFSWEGDGDDMDIEKLVRGELPNFHFDFDFEGQEWLEMELVALDPDLGDYFGTTEGALVVKAPEASLGIRAGDVLQKIGDHKISGPSQAFRVLDSYEPGETVTLSVLRKRQPQTLQIKVPEEEGKDARHHKVIRGHAPPAPPPAPARTPAGSRKG